MNGRSTLEGMLAVIKANVGIGRGAQALNLEVIAEGMEPDQQLIDRTRLTRLSAEVLQVV